MKTLNGARCPIALAALLVIVSMIPTMAFAADTANAPEQAPAAKAEAADTTGTQEQAPLAKAKADKEAGALEQAPTAKAEAAKETGTSEQAPTAKTEASNENDAQEQAPLAKAEAAKEATNELSITTQPASATVEYGKTATFQVVAEGDGLTYQWFYQKPNASKWYPSSMKGADTETLEVAMTATRNGQTYRCKVSDSHDVTVTSDAAVLSAEPLATELKITDQPVGASAPLGENVILSVSAKGEGVSYRWQFRAQGTETWYNSTADGAKTEELEIQLTEIRNGQQYRCVVSDISGASITSNAATIHVEGSVNILEHPRSASGDEGDIVMLSVIAEGDGLSYQWQFKRPGWDKWYNSTQDGAHTDTLVIPVIESRNDQMYRCVVRDANGGREISEIASLTLRGHVTVTSQPQSTYATPGDDAIMSVSVEGDFVAYQWQYQPVGKSKWYNSGMSGADTFKLTIPATIERNGQKYRCAIIEPSGAITYSDAATLTVRDPNSMP